MSYNVDLRGGEGPVRVERKTGKIVGGGCFASVSITYNFSYFFYNEIDEDDGIRWLNGRTGEETLHTLARAAHNLGRSPHRTTDSYWIPDPGNAGRDLEVLAEWAANNPEAVWSVT